eukprot:CAMPEP_0195519840 /NCGR_PEP_ID=MMETSP0794_2-20130614/15604_1 /TAXON_ID=515487 /ORGANISM="Stephanopyxis turris, Strain CCMP 815" /LENGTH=227 /DNA_ID=CAMNT_0040649071 /DNA_START=146 /DNA_END=829 /DNA_ORIENTATION=+
MSTSFGKWYDDQKEQEVDEASTSSSSWFGGGTDTLPVFGDTTQFSFANMKAGMEAQMPQKILGMNYQQRFKMFCALLFLSALFFALAFSVGLPMIAMRPQKFALSFTFGSLTFMGSFGLLVGPSAHFSSMLTAERLPFTTVYFGSMLATLYFTFSVGGASGYLLVIGASGCQMVCLLWYLISFLPGGSAGLHMLLKGMKQILKPVMLGCARCQAAFMAKIFGYATGS